MQVLSNQLAGTGIPSSGYIPTNYGANCEAWVTVSAEPTADFDTMEIFARCLNPSTTNLNGYRVALYHVGAGHQLAVTREDNDVATTLDDQPCTFTNGDKIGISCIDNLISGYVFHAGVWTRVSQATDTKYLSPGVIGLAMDSANPTTSIFDDFGGGTTTPSVVPKISFPTIGASW